jgi:hypothetical protein
MTASSGPLNRPSSASKDSYTEAETVERRDAVIKRMLATPPKPHSEMKLGKPRGKLSKSPKIKKKAPPKQG